MRWPARRWTHARGSESARHYRATFALAFSAWLETVKTASSSLVSSMHRRACGRMRAVDRSLPRPAATRQTAAARPRTGTAGLLVRTALVPVKDAFEMCCAQSFRDAVVADLPVLVHAGAREVPVEVQLSTSPWVTEFGAWPTPTTPKAAWRRPPAAWPLDAPGAGPKLDVLSGAPCGRRQSLSISSAQAP